MDKWIVLMGDGWKIYMVFLVARVKYEGECVVINLAITGIIPTHEHFATMWK